MSEYEMLRRHAERWASDKGRVFQADLVELALDLRGTHDALPANRWPADSVRHLMLVRWPAHGPAGVPDIGLLVQSLDTFWRFLRSTGRMAGGSAEPKKLLAEAKAAAKKMPAACNDRESFSVSKGILDFGQEIGISLDEAGSIDELNERLQQVMDAWNAQPDEVRMSRGLGAGNAGSIMGRALDEAADSMLRTGDLPPGWHLPEMPRLNGEEGLDDEEDGEGEDDLYLPNDPAISAPLARESGYLRQVLALADFADGRELTATGLLRPAVAREAYEALDLWAWESRAQEQLWFETRTESERKQAALHGWRSAGDCVALDRLWFPAVTSGLVDDSGRRAVRVHDNDPATDEDWMILALGCAVALVSRTTTAYSIDTLLMILLALGEPFGGGPTTVEELVELHWRQAYAAGAEGLGDTSVLRRLATSSLVQQIAAFDDCGWWVHRDDHLELTPLGWDVVLVLISALDEGVMWADDLTDE